MDMVEDFVRATEPLDLPEHIRQWGGVLLTSCLLGREVWTSVKSRRVLYPNVYVFFLAPSGLGKSAVLDAVSAALREWTVDASNPDIEPRVRLAPTEMTAWYALWELSQGFPDPRGGKHRVRCYAILGPEPGSFFGSPPDEYQLASLVTLWDAEREVYERLSVQGKWKNEQPRAFAPYITAGWGAQPSWIGRNFNEDIFQGGFPARCFLAYDGTEKADDFEFDETDDVEFKTSIRIALDRPMKEVAKAEGKFVWASDARRLAHDWIRRPLPFIPVSTLQPHVRRRKQQIGKLALIFAAARHPEERLIQLADFRDAAGLMDRMERDLEGIVKNVGANPDAAVEDEIVVWVRGQDRDVSEFEIRNRLRLRARGTLTVKGQLAELVASRQLVVVDETKAEPHRSFRAGS